MFGTDRRLQAEVAELRDEVRRLAAQVAILTPLADDAARLAAMAESAHTLSQSAQEAVRALEASAGAAGVGRPRSAAAFNTVYRAETSGFVSVWFEGGRTGVVNILVGDQDPPSTVVCTANSRNDLNSYAAAVVRPGEYWLLRTKHPNSAFNCTFTPLF